MRFDSLEDVAKKNDDQSKYVAVLALDGDEMGKWIAGEQTPKFLDQLACSAREYYKGKLSEDARRLLSPSYHMQFSEALGNFANHLAGRIVAHYDGQLVYAGGDDVLAILPADKALRCARALRAAFRGCRKDLSEPERNFEFAFTESDGFLKVEQGYPLLVPGPNAHISCGIAIGHCDHPLQHLVREAQEAEKRAKRDFKKDGFGRAAFAVSLLKRSGEKIHWGAKWDSGALELYELYSALRGRTREEQDESPVSARFPYALVELIQPYALEKGELVAGLDPVSLITAEVEHVLGRQARELDKGKKEKLQDAARKYLEELKKHYDEGRKSAFAEFNGLFMTAAFISRQRGEED